MMDKILIPTLIFVGLGLFSGLLLSVFSKVFAVKTSETVEKIKEALPGLNCGVCGFSGCEDYANNLVENDEIKGNLCVPGGAGTAMEISTILGKNFEDVDAIVAEVYCNGTDNTTVDLFEYDGIRTCSACNLYYGGKGKCSYGCIGFGDCIKACNYGAITIVEGIAVINKDLCIGCGMCKKMCPKEIIGMHKKSQNVVVKCYNCDIGKNTRGACSVGCIGCRKCEKTCQYGAIKVDQNKARIDYSLCTNCKECVAVCPIHCIIEV